MALNFPSMFDVQQQIRDADASKAASYTNMQPSKYRAMFLNEYSAGNAQNQMMQGLAGMLGGSPDPRIGKQQALDAIMKSHPNPESPEDFMKLSNALQGAGLYEYASKAVDWANDVRKSMPKADYSMSKADSEGFVSSMTTHLTTTGMLDAYNSIRFTPEQISSNEKSALDVFSKKEITKSLEDFAFSLTLPPYNLNKMHVSDMLSSGNWMIAYKGWVAVHGTPTIKLFAEQFIKTADPTDGATLTTGGGAGTSTETSTSVGIETNPEDSQIGQHLDEKGQKNVIKNRLLKIYRSMMGLKPEFLMNDADLFKENQFDAIQDWINGDFFEQSPAKLYFIEHPEQLDAFESNPVEFFKKHIVPKMSKEVVTLFGN